MRVVETGATAVAGSDGRFTLRGLAPGQYTIVVTYVGYPDATQTVTVAEDGASLSISMMRESASEEVVVVGERRAQAVALQDKKQADNVVETLYANDAGKLPDQNIGESLRRLPGLTIANDQGEGRYILIRGVDPNLVNVTLSSDALGRSFKLRVTAAALRSVDHRGGLDGFLLKASETELSDRAAKIRRDLKKKLSEQAAA